jgi:hypothetical protein
MGNTAVKTITSFDLYSWGPTYWPVNPLLTIQVIGGVVREVHSDSEVV